MKTLTFEPLHRQVAVHTGTDLLNVLLAEKLNVLMACKGKGICATCHVHVRQGTEKLSPPTDREKKTLTLISGADRGSRLACQCRVLGDGVVVELPDGMYLERAEDLMDLLGKRAQANILHPINGAVLIAKGKIITRSRLEELRGLNVELEQLRETVLDL